MDFEFVHLYKRSGVTMFHLPPMSTTKGYYLDDWKQMFWEGGVKVCETNSKLKLQFANPDGTNVAACEVPDNNFNACIQKTVDSQRGYAIRLTKPDGSFHWVGVAFRDRNDAFDFFQAIIKFFENKEIEKNPSKYAKEFEPKQDFSIKEGQKIQISFNEFSNNQPKKATSQAPIDLKQFKFEAPPDFGVKQPSNNQSQNNQFDFNSWGDFNTFGNTNTQQQQNAFGFQQQPQSAPQQQNNQNQNSWGQNVQFGQSQQQQAQGNQKKEVNLLDL